MKLYKSTHRIIIISCAILLMSSCGNKTEQGSRVSSLPYYNETTFTPQWITPESAILDTFHKISNFQLTNQEGQTITEKTFENKIYVTDFFFTTCPGICPKMTDNMAILQDEFIADDEVLLLSHSVTPSRDTVDQLKRYAKDKGVNAKKWHLVTGDRGSIYRLGRLDYFVEESLGLTADIDEFLHTENFVLIDKKRHIRGIYNGLNKASMYQLIADIKTLQLRG